MTRDPADRDPANSSPANSSPANPSPTNPSPANPGPPTADHGASAERTRLAWRRTTLSATAVALLSARPAFRPSAGVVPWLIAATAMTGWVFLVALGYRRVRGLAESPPHPGRRAVTTYALITAGFAVLGGLVVML